MEDLNSLLSELFRLLAIQVALIYNMCGNKAGNQSNAVDQIKSLFHLLAQKTQGICPVTLVILWRFILHHSEKYLRRIASVPVKFTDIQQRDKYSCLIL